MRFIFRQKLSVLIGLMVWLCFTAGAQEIKLPDKDQAFYSKDLDKHIFTQQPSFVAYEFKSKKRAKKMAQKIIDAYSDIKYDADTFDFKNSYVVLFKEDIAHMPGCKMGFGVDITTTMQDYDLVYTVVLFWIMFKDDE